MIRIGYGMDAHRLVQGRKLILCGVHIPYELGLLGHSDADVAVHALMDAILGAATLGDIGHYFPDSDPRYKDANSLELLDEVMKMVEAVNYTLGNADITIVAQSPKLAPYIEKMRTNIAGVCGVMPDRVNIKATTTEQLGCEGRGEGISAHSVVLLHKNDIEMSLDI